MNQVSHIIMLSSAVLILLSGVALSLPYTHDRHHDSGHNNPNHQHVDQGYQSNQPQFGGPNGGGQYPGQTQHVHGSQPGYGGQHQNSPPAYTGQQPQYQNQQHGNHGNHQGGYKTHGY